MVCGAVSQPTASRPAGAARGVGQGDVERALGAARELDALLVGKDETAREVEQALRDSPSMAVARSRLMRAEAAPTIDAVFQPQRQGRLVKPSCRLAPGGLQLGAGIGAHI